MKLGEDRLQALDEALSDLDGQRGYVPVASPVLTSLLAEIRRSRLLLDKLREVLEQQRPSNHDLLKEIDEFLE